MFALVPLAFLPVMTNLVTLSESTSAPTSDVHANTILILPTRSTTTASFESSVSPSWPDQTTSNAPLLMNNEYPKFFVMKHSRKVTKLTKSFALGFEPTFSMDDFHPFPRRPKPVTIVDFRKNGVLPRYIIRQNVELHRPEVAVLQSPYNEVGTYWDDFSGNP